MKIITVETTEPGSLQHRIDVPGHESLLTDIPRELGGGETAPDPHDYFHMALGACKAQTVMLYARAKKMALQRVKVEVSHQGTSPEGAYCLSVAIALEGDLSEAQRARLLEISDRCPIHKLMTHTEICVETKLV